MCGRYTLYGPHSRDRVLPDCFAGLEAFVPTWNASPGQLLPVCLTTADTSAPHVVTARWGLLPHWAKQGQAAPRPINARAETVATNACFRDAYRSQRRCLVPASGFYEWRQVAAGKQPCYIHPPDHALLLFAGLYEERHQDDGTPALTYTIITTEANSRLRPLHARMPVLLDIGDADTWLSASDPRALLRPCPDDWLTFNPVSTRVNSPRNNDAALTEPVEPGSAPG